MPGPAPRPTRHGDPGRSQRPGNFNPSPSSRIRTRAAAAGCAMPAVSRVRVAPIVAGIRVRVTEGPGTAAVIRVTVTARARLGRGPSPTRAGIPGRDRPGLQPRGDLSAVKVAPARVAAVRPRHRRFDSAPGVHPLSDSEPRGRQPAGLPRSESVLWLAGSRRIDSTGGSGMRENIHAQLPGPRRACSESHGHGHQPERARAA